MLKPAWGQDLIGLKVSTFAIMSTSLTYSEAVLAIWVMALKARVLGQGGGFDAFFHRFICEFFYMPNT